MFNELKVRRTREYGAVKPKRGRGQRRSRRLKNSIASALIVTATITLPKPVPYIPLNFVIPEK